MGPIAAAVGTAESKVVAQISIDPNELIDPTGVGWSDRHRHRAAPAGVFGAGVVLQAETPFRIGDVIEIDGVWTEVQEISLRTTVVDAYDGRRMRIPNHQMLSGPIVNVSERSGFRSEITVGLEYGTDLDRARAVILDAVGRIDAVFDDPRRRPWSTNSVLQLSSSG